MKAIKTFLILALISIPIVVVAGDSTTYYGLYKPNTGDKNWGTQVNSNFDKIDAALNNINLTASGKQFAESDPLFDSKFTSKNTDNLTQGSINKYANTTKENNGETAYGWGNHASAGYITDALSDGKTYGRKNGAWGEVAGGSQTPWTSDIDGDGYNLTTTGNISAEYFLGNASQMTGIPLPDMSDYYNKTSSDGRYLQSLVSQTTDNLAQGSTNKYADTTKENNGQTAYGWGNHASAGYLTDASSDGKTYGRKNGAWSEVTSNPTSASSRSFIITNPTASSDGPIWRTPGNITITAVHGVEFGGTNIVGMITNCDSNGTSCSPVNSTDITITTSNSNATQLASGNITAGNYTGWNTTSVSGTVTKAIITFDYTVN